MLKHRYYLLYLLILLKIYTSNKQSIYQHIFIIRSFYYESIIGFTHKEVIENAIIILLNSEGSEKDLQTSHCIISRKNGSIIKINAFPTKLYTSVIECKIEIYKLICHDIPKLEIGDAVFMLFNNAKPAELALKIPNKVKRNFVVCPGRMFAFVQWHLFVTAMELHRIHKVDLVVVYIQSVDSAVYELIKLYQLDGLVEIRVGISMPPHLDTLSYNPNSESQWNNQMDNFVDCLYDFRESTEFIAFPDWDDLMLTKNFVPWPNLLRQIIKDFPNVGSFNFPRFLGTFPILDQMFEKNYSLEDLWKNDVEYTENKQLMHTSGKVLVRPKLVHAARFHDSYVIDGYTQELLPVNEIFMIHARNFDNVTFESRLPGIDAIMSNFRRFYKQSVPKITKLFNSLPKSDPFVDQFNDCLGAKGTNDKWGKIVQKVTNSKQSRCYSFYQCEIVQKQHKCLNALNRWQVLSRSGKNIIYILRTSNFILRNNCSY